MNPAWWAVTFGVGASGVGGGYLINDMVVRRVVATADEIERKLDEAVMNDGVTDLCGHVFRIEDYWHFVKGNDVLISVNFNHSKHFFVPVSVVGKYCQKKNALDKVRNYDGYEIKTLDEVKRICNKFDIEITETDETAHLELEGYHISRLPEAGTESYKKCAVEYRRYNPSYRIDYARLWGYKSDSEREKEKQLALQQG
ncbi:hypothetical protein MHSWG343_00520 [Candidatus Mycoplasma haematohominis]|uniref:Uncharacterized protein n=1 Tax=Candidatus Mycoplasma haematohominis TaxID=1494318 RepID=A0A478FQ99_9MOLU|nr:hypothetical protein MHSWG343_00520 [Candidatus Mycoplasma haemohominis]